MEYYPKPYGSPVIHHRTPPLRVGKGTISKIEATFPVRIGTFYYKSSRVSVGKRTFPFGQASETFRTGAFSGRKEERYLKRRKLSFQIINVVASSINGVIVMLVKSTTPNIFSFSFVY
ncbi:MAG: hypothetical protein PHD97_07670 [Bacteroidales bacterium]|nr:hypothetical protein [Bacteroidales bacterium]